MVHRNVVLAAVAASSAAGVSAFQMPPQSSSLSLARASRAATTRAPGLRMQSDDKVTFGLAKDYLGDSAEAKQVFTFLQSKTFNPLTADQDKQVQDALKSVGKQVAEVCEKDGKYLNGDFVSTWVYGNVIKEGGFNTFSEKVNGRVAMLAFPCVLLQTFDGDFLDLLSSQPLTATFWTWLIIIGSVFTKNTDEPSISGEPMKQVMDALPSEVSTETEKAMKQVSTIFTPEAEMTNGRAAMAAMGVWIFTALFFT